MDHIARWWHDRASDLSEEELKQTTRGYWDRKLPTSDASPEQRIAWYIARLLPEELAVAEDRRHALEYPPCHTLTLLVGHSPEPLLQAIGVFQPRRIVLALNQDYGGRCGKSYGEELQGWITAYLAPLLPKALAIDLCVMADRPDAVFQSFCQCVLPDRQRNLAVIVDITGAKKSMVAGAFLFAAYADIPISYVDFDQYDAEYRRPLGYHCRIGTLANPYDAFRLREWERAQRMYETYRFRAAADALTDILAGLRQTPSPLASNAPSPFLPFDLGAVRTLLQAVCLYAAWDEGDYVLAHRLYQALRRDVPGFAPPAAVSLLAGVWPHAEETASAEDAARQLLDLHERLWTPPGSIFESNARLLAYAHDELARIERMVDTDEDHRSALLRAAGLDELLLKARLVRLWSAQGDLIELWDQDEREMFQRRSLTEDEQSRLYEALLTHQGTDHMRRALQKCTVYDKWLARTVPAFVKLDLWRTSYRLRPAAGVTPLVGYDRVAGLNGETLTQLRNQAIHMYLYVTQPIVRAAVQLARANLDDFRANWTHLCGDVPPMTAQDVGQIPWEQLCTLCGLDFLPFVPPREEHT
ncbi:MAG: hypothetical protein JW934_13220 [Anaerolineae bacterium]|nr:hypothetical protein [Anaerolineae bacterium]